MPKRTREQAAETREAILRAARKMFSEQGFSAAGVAAIAAEAGSTKGALFHYFSSKEDLFVAVWTALQIEMDAAARAAAIAGRSRDDPYAAFLAGCRVYLEWSMRPDYQKIVLIDGPSVLGMSRWHELDFELGRDNITLGTEYLARAGAFPLERVRSAAILLQSALNGAGFALSARHPKVTPEDVFETFEKLLRGLR